ncbi:hypothetical protein EVAR_89503_1 [Eumeta japonica]|uniref:Uncharacterized protein n=1 Tax=Eumeta variegata TaxID=151549 RepID=A0A4C1Y9E6_EUMVA|nr:hypothetical protein EVAR_89503_1 [Eumeta japonica]
MRCESENWTILKLSKSARTDKRNWFSQQHMDGSGHATQRLTVSNVDRTPSPPREMFYPRQNTADTASEPVTDWWSAGQRTF